MLLDKKWQHLPGAIVYESETKQHPFYVMGIPHQECAVNAIEFNLKPGEKRYEPKHVHTPEKETNAANEKW